MIYDKWFVADKAENTNLSYHSVITQYLYNRGIRVSEIAENMLYSEHVNHNPNLMKGMVDAVEIIRKYKNENILIYGDYDADGVTSVAVLHKVLAALGFERISFYVPSRDDGYGISADIVLDVSPKPKLVITVDNGITAHNEIARITESGIAVIVTDHHTVNESKYPHTAMAVVNPQQVDCGYPNTGLSGVGVVYKLAQALGDRFEQEDGFADRWIDIVALGMIGDMMPAGTPENRSIMKRGLHKMQSDDVSAGIRALANSSKGWALDLSAITFNDVAFNLVPPINASSRMDHPRHALNLLLCENEADAIPYADRLHTLNAERKTLQREIADSAVDEVEFKYADDPVIVHVVDDCKHGIVGLVAADISSKFNKPTFVLTQSDEDGILGGSGRSIEGFDLISVLHECKDLLTSYGGHSGAAGLGIHSDNVDKFRKRLSLASQKQHDPTAVREKSIFVDMELPLSHVTDNIYDVLQTLEPMGDGSWPHPTFVAYDVELIDFEVWSKSQRHVRAKLDDGRGNVIPMNGWHMAWLTDHFETNDIIDILYGIEFTDWPYRHLRLRLIDMRHAGDVKQPNKKLEVDTDKVRKSLGAGDKNKRRIV